MLETRPASVSDAHADESKTADRQTTFPMPNKHNPKSEPIPGTHNSNKGNGPGRPRLSVSRLKGESLRLAIKRDLRELQGANDKVVAAIHVCGDLLNSLFNPATASQSPWQDDKAATAVARIIGLLHSSASTIHGVIESRKPDRSCGRSDEVLERARAKAVKARRLKAIRSKTSGRKSGGKEVA